MIGQSRFEPATVANVSGTAFVAPDCSSDVLADLVASAAVSVRLNAYELTDPVLADALVAARSRGVAVTVLAQGAPVGGVPSGEWPVLDRLLEAGAEVRFMATDEDAHARYRHDHAKYMVVDDRWTLVTTENWKPAAFPPAGRQGNRGWGVVLDDPRVAAYFAEVFETDLGGRDVHPVTTVKPGAVETPSDRAYAPRFTPAPFRDATVTTVLAPDTADEVEALIRSATASVRIEQAYITNESGTRLQRYLAAAVDAARRGVEVRILLDGAWFNTEDEADNDEQVRLINRIADAEGLPLEARIIDLDAHGLTKVHTKGVVVDDRRVLVSSINWNEASPSFNREAGVIVDDPGTAAYFAAAFDADWEAGHGRSGRDRRAGDRLVPARRRGARPRGDRSRAALAEETEGRRGIQNFFAAQRQRSQMVIAPSSSPMTESAQRSIMVESSGERFVPSQQPRLRLMYWEIAARLMPSRRATSVCGMPWRVTRRQTISARAVGTSLRIMASQTMMSQTRSFMQAPQQPRGATGR